MQFYKNVPFCCFFPHLILYIIIIILHNLTCLYFIIFNYYYTYWHGICNYKVNKKISIDTIFNDFLNINLAQFN